MADIDTLLQAALVAGADRSRRGSEWCDIYTTAVDAWLADVYEREIGDAAGTCLVAIGGHGRRDLCPQSDLDLVLLVSGKGRDDEAAQRLWYPLWDARFKVGHASRTVAETLALADTDTETSTALISARLLAGDDAVFRALASEAEQQRARRARQWLRRLSEGAAERRSQFGDVAHDVEPDLKDGAGGLRDWHLLGWAMALGVEVPVADVDAARAAHEVLLTHRIALHLVTGRPSNRLLLQEQNAVADLLGVEPIEMMQSVALAARQLSWVVDTVTPAMVSRRSRMVRSRAKVLRDDPDLGARVMFSPNDVRLADGALDARDALRVGAVAAERGVPIARETLDALAGTPPLPTPWPPDARRLFIRILMAGAGAIPVIEALDMTGAWERLLPEWVSNRARPQRNPYHRWNVDRHLTETVAKAATLTGRVDRPDLLLLGALLHDIGKGTDGRDHSEVGAQMSVGIMERLGYDQRDSETVVALVRDHLLLPDVASRRDLDDPATIDGVAQRVTTVPRLRLMAALAEADGCATGPSAWGGWKRDLVRTLVNRVIDHMGPDSGEQAKTTPLDPQLAALVERGEPCLLGDGDTLRVLWPDQPGLFATIAGVLTINGVEVMNAALRSEGSLALDEVRVRTVTGDAPTWDRIIEQLGTALSGPFALRARVAQRAKDYRRNKHGFGTIEPWVGFETATDATVVEVATPDSVGLLYRLTSTLTEMKLDIRRAVVATMGPDVVDTFYVVTRDGGRLTDAEQQQEVRQALLHAASVH